MGDYLYNSEMGPRACVSICQAAWSTDGLAVAHLLSLTLHCILLFRSSIVLVDLCIFLRLVRKVKTESEPSPSTLLWIFYLFQPDWIFFFFLSFVFFFTPAPLSGYRPLRSPSHPLPPIFHSSLCPRVWFLGYALLTHSDSPAIWTPCLSTDNRMLSEYSSGKNLNLLLN